MNDRSLQNDSSDQHDFECSPSRSNRHPPVETITRPVIAINTPGATTIDTQSSAAILDLTNQSCNIEQQNKIPVRRQSSQNGVNPNIAYLQDILSRTGETSPASQMTSNAQPANGSPIGQNSQRRLSTNSSVSHRLGSANLPYSRQSSPTPSAGNPLNAFFTSSSRRQPQTRVSTKKPRRIATQRFEKTIDATDKLVEVIERKNELKENYYKHKLELMEANVNAQSRIAASLVDIAHSMRQN